MDHIWIFEKYNHPDTATEMIIKSIPQAVCHGWKLPKLRHHHHYYYYYYYCNYNYILLPDAKSVRSLSTVSALS